MIFYDFIQFYRNLLNLIESNGIINLIYCKIRPGTQRNKFATRTNAGEVVCKFSTKKEDVDVVEWASRGRGDRQGSLWQPTVQPFCSQSLLNTEYKYMFSRLRDKHEILDEHIHQLGDIMADALKIDEWNANNQLQSVILISSLSHSH